MAINFLTSVDLNGNELIGAPIQNLATAPSVGTFAEGQMYFNTTNNNLYVLANGAFVDLTSQGDITGVTTSTPDQLGIATSTGPIPAFSIKIGAVADGQEYLVTSQAVFNAIDALSTGVETVTTGSAATITIGGTAANPTVAANTAAIAASGTALATADQINTFVTDFGYTTNVGTVTSVSAGDGIIITGTATVTPTVGLLYEGTTNYIEVPDAGTATSDDLIAFSADTSNIVQKTALKDVPMAALTAVKTYVDAAVAGSTSFQGGYNAGTNIPGLIPGLMSVTGVVELDATVTVAGSETLFTTEFVVGDSIVAGGETRIVSAIASDTFLTVSVAFTVTATDSSPERIPAVITIEKGQQWVVTADGVFFTEQLRIGDLLIANVDAPTVLASWTTVQSNVDLATATVAGIASFSADNFLVSAAGAVTIKDNGVILGTETTGNYVAAITTAGDGLTGGVASEGSTAALSLTLGSIASGTGTDFVMADSGDAGSQYLTSISDAAAELNSGVTFADTITANATVTHNFGTKDVIVQLYDITTFETVYADIARTTTNAFTVSFGTTPTHSIRVLVQKIG
jgi:hypothetical protein